MSCVRGSFKGSEKQLRWAYRKWCEGHSMTEIAAALGVDPSCLYWQFRKRNWKRVPIPLEYREET